MSQLKKSCVEQIKHMFKHLCSPKTGVIFVPVEEEKRKREVPLPLPYPSLFSTNSATEPVVKEHCSSLQPIYSWPWRGQCGGWATPMVLPAGIHALVSPSPCEGRSCDLHLSNSTCRADTRYFHDYCMLSKTCLLPDSLVSLSLVGFEEASCPESYSHKEVNSVKNRRELEVGSVLILRPMRPQPPPDPGLQPEGLCLRTPM